MGLSRLAQAMARDNALSPTVLNPNAPHVLPATPASVDSPGVMPDWASAMLIMNGCTAQWALNYWRVVNRWNAVAHVSRFNNFDEWQAVLKDLADRKG